MGALDKILGVARVLLPNNSPLRTSMEKAAQLAGQYAPTKDGIAQLMAANGKRREDLLDAFKQLENPMVKRALSYIPGLGDAVNSAASELQKDQSFGNSTPTSSSNSMPQSHASPTVNGDIWDRINKL